MAKPDETNKIFTDPVKGPGNRAEFPTAVGPDITLIFRQLSNQSQDHSAGMIGNVVDTIGSIIDDHDALFVRRFYIDIIRPSR